MATPEIIGLTGRAASGKDTFCTIATRLLAQERIPSATIACAGKLKEICTDVFETAYGIDRRHFHGTQDDKNELLEQYGLGTWSGRRILQFIGTEGFRHIAPTVWSSYMFGAAQRELQLGARVVFVSDVRFLNEANVIQRNKGIIVRMKRPEADDPYTNQGIEGHSSEVELLSICEDFVLDNRGGPLEELEAKIRVLLCQLGFLPSIRKPRG